MGVDSMISLAGRTVLIARAAGRAVGLRARLEALGAVVLVAPVTMTVADGSGQFERVAGVLESYDWVVLTSANAVTYLAERAAGAGVDLERVDMQWAAVGPATARAMEALGLQVGLMPGNDYSAAGLVEAFSALTSDDGITGDRRRLSALLPQSALASPVLEDGLRGLGWSVEVVRLYTTVPCPLPDDVLETWQAGKIDVVLLAAGSAVRQIAEQVGCHLEPSPVATGTVPGGNRNRPRWQLEPSPVATGTVPGGNWNRPRWPGVVAIGEPTAAVARELGMPVAAVAAQADDDSVLLAICSALGVG